MNPVDLEKMIEKVDEMTETWINGNRSDVATWLDSMSGQRAALATVLFLRNLRALPKQEQDSFITWVEVINQ